MKYWAYTQSILSIAISLTVAGCIGGSGFTTSPSLLSGNLPGATSATPSPLLKFTTQPSGGGVATGFSQQPVVALYDASGNALTSNVVVKLSLVTTAGSAESIRISKRQAELRHSLTFRFRQQAHIKSWHQHRALRQPSVRRS